MMFSFIGYDYETIWHDLQNLCMNYGHMNYFHEVNFALEFKI